MRDIYPVQVVLHVHVQIVPFSVYTGKHQKGCGAALRFGEAETVSVKHLPVWLLGFSPHAAGVTASLLISVSRSFYRQPIYLLRASHALNEAFQTWGRVMWRFRMKDDVPLGEFPF
jgi:hypothetical protein